MTTSGNDPFASLAAWLEDSVGFPHFMSLLMTFFVLILSVAGTKRAGEELYKRGRWGLMGALFVILGLMSITWWTRFVGWTFILIGLTLIFAPLVSRTRNAVDQWRDRRERRALRRQARDAQRKRA